MSRTVIQNKMKKTKYSKLFFGIIVALFALTGQVFFPFKVSASVTAKNYLSNFNNTRSVQAVQLTEGSYSTVGANIARTQPVTASSFAIPTIVNTAFRMLNILPSIESVVHLAPGDNLKLQLTDYDDASTDLLTVSTFDGYVSGDFPKAFVETTYNGDTIWLMWIGNSISESLNTNVWRSIDHGATWTKVQNLPNVAPPPDSQSIAVNNGTIVWGEYVKGFSHPRFYMSKDGGVSWNNDTPIYQENDYTSHTHQVFIKSDNPTSIYIILGDNSVWQERIDYNSETGVWSKIKDNLGLGLFIDGLIPFDNGKILTSGFGGIGSLDENTWQETPKVFFPMPWALGGNVKYQYQQPAGTGTSIRHLALDTSSGILYGAMNNYSAPPNNTPLQGLYVSADYGDTWTSIYRIPTGYGFRWAGFLKDRVYFESENGIFRMNKISAAAVSSLRLDNSIPNNIALRQNITFTDSSNQPSFGNWAKYTDSLGPTTVEAVAGGNDDSGHTLHVVTAGTSVDTASGRNLFLLGPLSSILTNPPAVGTAPYYLIKFKARSSNYASNYNPLRAYLFGSSGVFTTLYSRPTNEWSEFIVAGQLSPTDNNSIRLIIRVDKTSGDNQVFDVYFDDFQLYFSSTLLDAKTWNILPNLPNAGESNYTDFNINSNNWSLGFDWIGPAYDEYGGGTLLTVKDIPNANYLKVNWNATTKKYELTDGSTTVSTTVTYNRLHFDLTRFYLVNNGTNTLLYIIDPLNGTQVIGTGSSLALSSVGRAHFGVAADSSSNYMHGNYFNIKGWDNSLSGTDITNDLLNAGSGIYIDSFAPTGGSITYSDDNYTTSSVSLIVNDGNDSISGINTASRIVQRKSAVLSNGTCGNYGSFATATSTGTYPNFTDSTVFFGNCYQYQYLIQDNAGNQAIYTSTNTAKVNTAPSNTGSQGTGTSAGIIIVDKTALIVSSTAATNATSTEAIIISAPISQTTSTADKIEIGKKVESAENKEYFKRKLGLGAAGKDVNDLQFFLKIEGYFKSPNLTGWFGSTTRAALKKFQKSVKLKATGKLDDDTRGLINQMLVREKNGDSAIKSSKLLKYGSFGKEVKELQLKLKEFGYFTFPTITGYFGLVTRNAVIKLQKDFGIAQVGFVDIKTIDVLNRMALLKQ